MNGQLLVEKIEINGGFYWVFFLGAEYISEGKEIVTLAKEVKMIEN